MYDILIYVAESLIKNIDVITDCQFLMKTFVLLMITFKCKKIISFSSNEKNRHIVSTFLRKLAIKDDSSYKVLSTILSTNCEKSFNEILEFLISNAINKFNPPITEWIFAVPLIHFMMKKCNPFDPFQRLSWDLVDNHHKRRQVCSCAP